MAQVTIPGFTLKDQHDKWVLDTPAVALHKGEVFALTGPSGGGKSLWLRSLFGWASPQQVATLSPRQGSFLMIQDPSQGLTPLLSVQGHFREVCDAQTLRKDVPPLLVELGLDQPEFLARRVETLSGGERQRLMLALILIRNPQILVCDEPAASLDPDSEEALWQILMRLRKQRHLTLVFVTHQLQLIQQHADRVMLLVSGKQEFLGDREAFFTQPRHVFHETLIENYNTYQRNEQQAPRDSETKGPPLLEISKLFLSFGARQLFRDFDWRIYPGQWWWLRGPSGSGKTSLGRIIAGLLHADDGQVLLEGNFLTPSLVKRSVGQRRAVQYLFQHGSGALNPARTIATQLKEAFSSNHTRLADLLRDLHLDHLDLNRSPSVFSLGEMQRFNLTRALARNPRLIVGDELLSALDLGTKGVMIQVLDRYREETGAATVLITHDVRPQSLRPGYALQLQTGIAKTSITPPTMADCYSPTA